MPTPSTSTQDEEAIKANMAAFANAWNIHDAKPLAALSTQDNDFVNVMGQWLKGRAAIEQGYAEAFAAFMRESHQNFTATQVRFIKPDVAVVHTTWELVGQMSRDGEKLPSRNGLLTAGTIYKDGTW